MPEHAGSGEVGAAPTPAPVGSGYSGDGAALRLGLSAVVALFVALTMPVLWLVSGFGSFWPLWVWFGLGCMVLVHACVEYVLPTRRLAEHRVRAAVLRGYEAVAVSTILITLAIWVLDGSETFWPGWPIATLLIGIALIRLLEAQSPGVRAQALVDRVDELTRSRSGALDVQHAELRRIERDLHDGAQARLVALSMQLGRAEHHLGPDGDPKTLELIRGAHEDARLAIAELRDLARGIAPPVLIDRGLQAAVDALAKRSQLQVEVIADLPTRPPSVVESAAYFVTAEALTNAAKHARADAVQITLSSWGGRLRLVIADDGIGGADPEGGGLLGLRQRVEALDGTLHVSSTTGQGTTITAELPCGS